MSSKSEQDLRHRSILHYTCDKRRAEEQKKEEGGEGRVEPLVGPGVRDERCEKRKEEKESAGQRLKGANT